MTLSFIDIPLSNSPLKGEMTRPLTRRGWEWGGGMLRHNYADRVLVNAGNVDDEGGAFARGVCCRIDLVVDTSSHVCCLLRASVLYHVASMRGVAGSSGGWLTGVAATLGSFSPPTRRRRCVWGSRPDPEGLRPFGPRQPEHCVAGETVRHAKGSDNRRCRDETNGYYRRSPATQTISVLFSSKGERSKSPKRSWTSYPQLLSRW